MKLGPTKIIHPPQSNNLVRLRTYISGSTRGATTYWSDGWVDTPNLSQQALAYRNPIDGLIFWLDEAEEIASQVDPRNRLEGEIDEYDHLPFVEEELTEYDYLHAIADGLADDFEPEDARNRLFYLRANSWQRGNDPIRKDQSKSLSPKQKKNVEALVEMHATQSTFDRLMRAELLRQLERFEDAIEELEEKFDDDSSDDFAMILFMTILMKDSKVTRLKSAPFPVVFE